MLKNIDNEYIQEKELKIKDLIESVLSIKRQREKENFKEKSEIKLGRRLEQRSYPKLSEEILEHLITRYKIDKNKLPTKDKIIEMMINFLGNIQKTPDNYNLNNNKGEIKIKKEKDNILGKGFHGQVYLFKLDSNQTKKNSKTLAYKEQKKIEPYTIDIHITSAILLALYDFQPKYYNLFFSFFFSAIFSAIFNLF